MKSLFVSTVAVALLLASPARPATINLVVYVEKSRATNWQNWTEEVPANFSWWDVLGPPGEPPPPSLVRCEYMWFYGWPLPADHNALTCDAGPTYSDEFRLEHNNPQYENDTVVWLAEIGNVSLYWPGGH
jgi:hypothetical protein